MRRRGVDASTERSSRSSPVEELRPIAVTGPTLPDTTLVDGWDRQDGYRRQLVITVSPVALSSHGGLDGSTLSFSSFVRPLVRSPYSVLPTDTRVIVPIFAVSESETLLPLTDPTSTPTSGVATRTELARHADATFESVTGKSKADVQLPVSAQLQSHHHIAAIKHSQHAAQLEQFEHIQRKRKRDPSPAPSQPAVGTLPVAPADLAADNKRRTKVLRLNEAPSLMHSTSLSTIDELTPRNGRHMSPARKVVKRATSPSASLPDRTRSRERSSSRARAFAREHNPPVSHLHMPEHTERAWAARKRRLEQQQLEEGVDEDDDTDTLEQLVYPTPFALLRRQRRRFVTRMTVERNRMHDMWMNFCYRVRLDQEARELEENVQDEPATSPTPDTSAATTDLTTADHTEPKSRRRRERSHVTAHANDWMRADFKFVKQDIDAVKRAILEAEAAGRPVGLSPVSQSTTPTSSPASSPRLVYMNGKLEKEIKADSPVSLADIRAELAQSNPPSPTPSLMSLSPPSSRSVSPLPSIRTHSTDTSPAHEDMSPHSALTDFSSLPDTHLGSTDKQALRSLAQPHSQPTAKGGCLVEAIVAHREQLLGPAVKASSHAPMLGHRSSDMHLWRVGVPCMYLVQWVESEERTWEREDQLQPSMINEYWAGRGQQLWDEKDISELHRILKAHMRQSVSALPIGTS